MKHVQIVEGEQALAILLQIRMDGFVSGYATALLSAAVAAGVEPERAEEYADRHADAAADQVYSDPVLLEAQRREIVERLHGTDTGPFTPNTVPS
ncbi:MAG: hypothetical protein QM582_14010 [Micropruina sp.]|uniref:hypothetical protein n=1 Tax=Micropruina sp. TaxID=2737536 RepID=UPI0039E52145